MNEIDPNVRLLAEELIRVCCKQGYALTGFIFGNTDPPFLWHIRNVEESGEPLVELHTKLCEMTFDGRPIIEKRVRMTGDA